jgi:ribosomal protein S12 methylthiotransferase
MMGLVRDAGHEITASPAEADVLVVNTCAFIDRAKEESIDAILEMAQLKQSGRAKTLVVTGCLGERYRDELRAEIPEIDVVLGTGDVPDIVAAVSNRPPVGAAPVTLFRSRADLRTTDTSTHGSPEARKHGSTAPTFLYDATMPRVVTTPRHYAYVKIAEGCDYTCAFCIIPTLRGAYRSRPEDSVVQEAEALAARGVRELLLISQDTTFFGRDRQERDALPRLLRRLDRVDGLAWIRLLYLYPTTVSDDVVAAIAESEKVCRYIDLPLQHASAAVLRRMRRPGNRQVYDALLGRIRGRMPDVTLRTTFIVGFPGETADDFAELCAFVEDTGFDHVGVFTYSHEEGTRAFAAEDDVPAGVKAARRAELMERQQRIVAARLNRRVGERVTVMVDGPSPESGLVWQGRLAGQAPEIDSVVYLDQADPDQLRPGRLLDLRVVGARGYDLVAAPA